MNVAITSAAPLPFGEPAREGGDMARRLVLRLSSILPAPLPAVPILIVEMTITARDKDDHPIERCLIHGAWIGDRVYAWRRALIGIPRPLPAISVRVIEMAVACTRNENSNPIHFGLINNAGIDDAIGAGR